jgi:hypothetical protein
VKNPVWIAGTSRDAGRRCIGTINNYRETILKLAKQEKNC